MMFAQLSEYTPNHRSAYLKRVNFMVCELYLNRNIFLFFINLFYFIYFWLHWVFVAAHGLSLVVASGGYSSLPYAGFSLRWLLLLRSMGSRRMGFSSCGTRAQ